MLNGERGKAFSKASRDGGGVLGEGYDTFHLDYLLFIWILFICNLDWIIIFHVSYEYSRVDLYYVSGYYSRVTSSYYY